jgi:hypothetical protein
MKKKTNVKEKRKENLIKKITKGRNENCTF